MMASNKNLFQSKTLSELLEALEIPSYAENYADDEFPIESLYSFSIDDIAASFMFSREQAAKIADAIEIIRKQKQKPLKGFPKFIHNFFSQTQPPTKKQSFLSHFEDLSNLKFYEGDDWNMDPCSSASSAICDFVKQDFKERGTRYDTHVNVHRWTPLMYACALGRDYVVDILLSGNPNLLAQNNSGETALMLASSYGHVRTIERLQVYANEKMPSFKIKDVLGVDMADNHGFTALHHATFYAQDEVIKLLLQMGADPNQCDHKGMTPTLMACIDEIQEHCLPILLEHGGDILRKNQDDQNGFDIACGRDSLKEIYDEYTRERKSKSSGRTPYGRF